jgi:hypothetical protein
MKLLLIIFVIILSVAPSYADIDNDIKYWLGDKKIKVENGKILGIPLPKTVKIDISKISDLAVVDKETSLNPFHSITTLLVRFKYDYKNNHIPCIAAITYTWATTKGPSAPKNLENIIVLSEL